MIFSLMILAIKKDSTPLYKDEISRKNTVMRDARLQRNLASAEE